MFCVFWFFTQYKNENSEQKGKNKFYIRVDTDKGKLYFGLEKANEIKLAYDNLFEVAQKWVSIAFSGVDFFLHFFAN